MWVVLEFFHCYGYGKLPCFYFSEKMNNWHKVRKIETLNVDFGESTYKTPVQRLYNNKLYA